MRQSLIEKVERRKMARRRLNESLRRSRERRISLTESRERRQHLRERMERIARLRALQERRERIAERRRDIAESCEEGRLGNRAMRRARLMEARRRLGKRRVIDGSERDIKENRSWRRRIAESWRFRKPINEAEEEEVDTEMELDTDEEDLDLDMLLGEGKQKKLTAEQLNESTTFQKMVKHYLSEEEGDEDEDYEEVDEDKKSRISKLIKDRKARKNCKNC